MDPALFLTSSPGQLVPISGDDPRFGPWRHHAFVPEPLPDTTPRDLSATTFNTIAAARAALAALDASARQLPNPALLRQSTLRREAQSTSALEGTYAPLAAVLAADDDASLPGSALREVLNYVHTAEHGFAWLQDGRVLTMGLLQDLQGRLVRDTPVESGQSGRVRTIQVVIGAAAGSRVQDARFVPPPPGPELERQVRDLVDWVGADHVDLDPVVAAGLAHYQFETLHPFHDGNGRIGRLLVVLHLLHAGVLTEPTLTVSPWFEARRADYYEALFAVSATGDWDRWIRYFARGLEASARDTERQLVDLLGVQADLKERIRSAGLRAESARQLVDVALERPIFTVRQVQRRLGLSAYGRANSLVKQLVGIGVLRQYDDAVYDRHFTAPDVLAVLLR